MFLVGLLSLEFQNGFANMGRAEAAFSANVLEDGLAGGGLG